MEKAGTATLVWDEHKDKWILINFALYNNPGCASRYKKLCIDPERYTDFIDVAASKITVDSEMFSLAPIDPLPKKLNLEERIAKAKVELQQWLAEYGGILNG